MTVDINQFPQKWNVIPAGKNLKYPLFKWDRFKEERFPRSELHEHEGNVAVICGKTSNNLFAIDLDYCNGMSQVYRDQAFETIYNCLKKEYPKLAKTRIHKTPHGHHLLYYLEDIPKTEHIKNCFKGNGDTTIFLGYKITRFDEILDGVDIQGDMALAIIPPSKVDGLEYKTYLDNPIKKLNLDEFNELKQFFLLEEPKSVRKAFIDIVNGKLDIHEQKAKTGKDEHVYWKYMYIECYWNLQLLPEQLFDLLKRNQKAFDFNKTIAQLKTIDLDKLKPMTKETYAEYFPDYIKRDKIKDMFSPSNSSTEIILKDMNVKQLTDYLVDVILEDFDLITLNDSRQIMIREGSYYSIQIDKVWEKLRVLVREFPKGSYLGYKSNVEEIIKDSTLTDRDIFYDDDHFINFLNGVYDIFKEKLIPHDKFDKTFFYVIPHNYYEGHYKCTNFKKALNQWLIGDRWSKVLYNDIFEMFGLCMSTITSLKKAFLNYGPTDSGKTQFLNLLIYIIGILNTSSVKLHRLSKNEFGTRRIQFRLLNGSGEIPKRKIKYTDIFKELTGDDDLIPCEIKGGAQFEFKPYAKFWFNANDIPPLDYVKDDAFFNRFILIPFPNQFKNTNENFKLKFWKELTDDYEIQGIIHEAMKGLKRLLERKSFRADIVKNTKHEWLFESDPVYRFLDEYCKKVKGNKILSDELYDIFNEVGEEYLPVKSFTVELQKYGIYKRQLRSGGARPYFYINVELKNVKKEAKNNEQQKITKEV